MATEQDGDKGQAEPVDACFCDVPVQVRVALAFVRAALGLKSFGPMGDEAELTSDGDCWITRPSAQFLRTRDEALRCLESYFKPCPPNGV